MNTRLVFFGYQNRRVLGVLHTLEEGLQATFTTSEPLTWAHTGDVFTVRYEDTVYGYRISNLEFMDGMSVVTGVLERGMSIPDDEG